MSVRCSETTSIPYCPLPEGLKFLLKCQRTQARVCQHLTASNLDCPMNGYKGVNKPPAAVLRTCSCNSPMLLVLFDSLANPFASQNETDQEKHLPNLQLADHNLGAPCPLRTFWGVKLKQPRHVLQEGAQDSADARDLACDERND